MVIQCCACKRIRQDEQWVEANDPEGMARLASHGYCPECADKAYQQFLELQLLLSKEALPAA